MPERRTFVLSRAGLRRHPAVRGELDGRQPVALGPSVAEHADGAWASASPGSRSSAPTSAVSRATRTRAVPALDAVRHAHARSAATTPRSAMSTSTPGPSARSSRSSCASAIRLRYRLLPYLYAAFLQAAETGAPVQRPLVFDYQYDPTVRDIDDEYLLGADLLVAPVVDGGRRPRGRSICRRDAGTTGTPASSRRRQRFVDTPDADGPHPDLRPRRCGHPDVARGAAVN